MRNKRIIRILEKELKETESNLFVANEHKEDGIRRLNKLEDTISRLGMEIIDFEFTSEEDIKKVINNLLEKSPITITFEKKDGSLRDMKCTNKMEFIPKKYHPKGASNYDTVTFKRLFDIDKQGWRTVTWANVKTVTVTS